nr:CDP-alcohol phosphatidyltransferase family protein [uncultured Intestinibacter sp.]
MCGILDVLDGFIARKFNVTSKLGAKLDSIPDMIMIFVILFRFVPTMGLNLFSRL